MAGRFLKLASASVALSLMCISSAHALQLKDLANRETSVANFDPDNLGPVLTELGLSWETGTLSNGRTVIGARTSGDVAIVLYPTACLNNKSSNCIGLRTMAIFTGRIPSLQSVSDFNTGFPFTSAGVLDDGSYISRYDIADYGIPRGNIESSMKNFLNAANIFRQQMEKDRYVASLEPETGSGDADSYHTPLASSSIAQNEGTLELIEILFKDPEIDQSKITNFIQD